MPQHDFKKTAAGSVIIPNLGYDAFYFDVADGYPKYKDDAGAVHFFPGSLVWRGTYAGGTSYVPNDLVAYDNSTYICILATTGHLPSDPVYWSLAAYKGMGDVVGPAGAVANRIVLFNGATGKIIKDSGKYIYPEFNVRDYGAVGDGVTDDTIAIQSAITACGVAGGGNVIFPEAHYAITATLVMSASGVELIGDAGGHWMNVAGVDYTTQGGSWIHWMGNSAGTMIQIEPVAGASNLNLKDIHIREISIDGRHPTAIPNPLGTFGTQAGIGISIKSVSGFHISCVYIQDCSTAALDMGVVSGALGEAKCCRNGLITRLVINQQDELAAAGIGVRMDGAGTTSTNMNTFTNCQLFYKNGTAIKILCAGYNQFVGVICERYSGTGIGVEFNGSNTGANYAASFNQFFGGSAGAGGMISRGTGLTYPAFDNAWWGYCMGSASTGMNEPQPVIEAGSTFVYTVTGAAQTAFNSARSDQKILVGSAIATSGTGETLLHKATIPANSVAVGDCFKIRVHGFSSSTGTLIFRIKIGTLGTTGDAQSWISLTSAAQVANQRAGFEGIVHLRAVGASGVARSEALGYAQAALLPTLVAAPADTAINTTSIWYIDVTCTCSVGTFTTIMCTIEAM